MRDILKRDSAYARRVLSGILEEPRAGVMSSRSSRKADMSNSWSVVMLTVSGTSSQEEAVVIPLPIVTIEDQIACVIFSLSSFWTMKGRIDLRIERDDVVACCQGGVVLVVVENEYLSTIGLARAVSEAETAPLL